MIKKILFIVIFNFANLVLLYLISQGVVYFLSDRNLMWMATAFFMPAIFVSLFALLFMFDRKSKWGMYLSFCPFFFNLLILGVSIKA